MTSYQMEFWADKRMGEELEAAATRRMLRATRPAAPSAPWWRMRLAIAVGRRIARRAEPA